MTFFRGVVGGTQFVGVRKMLCFLSPFHSRERPQSLSLGVSDSSLLHLFPFSPSFTVHALLSCNHALRCITAPSLHCCLMICCVPPFFCARAPACLVVFICFVPSCYIYYAHEPLLFVALLLNHYTDAPSLHYTSILWCMPPCVYCISSVTYFVSSPFCNSMFCVLCSWL